MSLYEPIKKIQYSIIRAIAEKVLEENRQLPPNEKIINLTMGQNYIGDPTPVIKRIHLLYDERIAPMLYAPSLGTYLARRAIAEHFYRLWYGISLETDDVMITDGGMGAIRNAMAAIINDGDIVVIDPLTFIYVLDTLTVFGRKYRLYTLPGDKSNYFIPTPSTVIEHLQELAIKHPDKNIVYYTQFGFNPVGAFRSSTELKQIVEFIDETNNVYLVNDIVYHLIRFDSKFEIPLASYFSSEGKRIVDCDTLSKPFSLMGLRVGAMITRDRELFETAAKVQQYTVVSPNILACEIWKVVGNPEYFPILKDAISTNNNKIKRNFEIMERYLKESGLNIISPKQGTLYIFFETPYDSWEFTKDLIKNARVAIVPGIAFEKELKLGKHYARITLSFPTEQIDKAGQKIKEFVQKRDI